MPDKRLEMGDSEMKINLTKLLESPTRVTQLSPIIPLTALYIEQTDGTTGDNAPYSFELGEK